MSKVDYSHDSYERPKLKTPNGEKKLLLHSCCAPCAGEIMEALAASEIDTTIYFYNPNIHPFDEYELRKEENIRFAEKLGMPIIDADYDRDEWFARTRGQEHEPERGARCTTCFDMRFQKTAKYASENNFDIILLWENHSWGSPDELIGIENLNIPVICRINDAHDAKIKGKIEYHEKSGEVVLGTTRGTRKALTFSLSQNNDSLDHSEETLADKYR